MGKLWIGIAVGLLVAGALLGRWIARWQRRRALSRRFARGRQGELEAVELLTDAGYRILDDQHTLDCAVLVDGEPRPYGLRADLLVTKNDKRYIAEVKTGDRAPDPTYKPTRRQLLEYSICYPVDGVLLVDMQAREIHDIAWEGAAPPQAPLPWRRYALPVAVALGIGLILGLILGAS